MRLVVIIETFDFTSSELLAEIIVADKEDKAA
jgi:hypothetical protein